MSLTNLTQSSILVNNPLDPTTQGSQTATPAAESIPATPQGSTPVVQQASTSQVPPDSQASNAAESTTIDLEKYAKKPDTTTNEGQPPKTTTSSAPTNTNAAPANNLPTVEEFGQVAARLQESITIDETLAAEVVGGGEGAAAALAKLLSNTVKETMARTLHAGALTSTHLQQSQSAQLTASTANSLKQEQLALQAANEVTKLDPSYGEGVKQTILQDTIKTLRTSYPEAPIELIGKKAAELLSISQPTNESKTNSKTETDWTNF